ncbi:MAG: carbohydrate-binding module family 20 domain-containing protein, partial [Pirellula sp.]
MRTITWLILAISLGVAPQISCEAQDKQTSTPKPATAKVTWRVIVPADTPSGSKLFIAGNIDEFGPWQPNAFELNPTTDGRYEASLDIPVGTRVEYKV